MSVLTISNDALNPQSCKRQAFMQSLQHRGAYRQRRRWTGFASQRGCHRIQRGCKRRSGPCRTRPPASKCCQSSSWRSKVAIPAGRFSGHFNEFTAVTFTVTKTKDQWKRVNPDMFARIRRWKSVFRDFSPHRFGDRSRAGGRQQVIREAD